MGYFSWRTSDTSESIPARTSSRNGFSVALILPDNTRYIENSYEGYGEFCGKDIFEVIVDINKNNRNEFEKWPINIWIASMEGQLYKRKIGIELLHRKNIRGDFKKAHENGLILPKIARNLNAKYEDLGFPENCEFQGFFYD